MKYMSQFAIILLATFAGQLLNNLVPLPVPAAIWGMIILFALLSTGLV
ncbi:MAG: CidA/LrgA family protein, partial [Firmicutes bacterium]|nr:CidA/LrgA family protein [Bacillota bacterium]